MGAYLNFTYGRVENNNALREAFTYIGMRYGRLAYREGKSNLKYMDAGMSYVAKQFGRFRKNAIRNMTRSYGIGNCNDRMWRIHKQIFGKAFALIVRLLSQCPQEDQAYVNDLLSRLYSETFAWNNYADKNYSDVLVPIQKMLLKVNSTHYEAEIAVAAQRVLNDINRGDRRLP